MFDSPFKRYCLAFFSLLTGLALLLGAILYTKARTLPPPPFSGSISFDEKAVWLAERLDKPYDILAIGSSMTVNNLHPDAFPDQAVINASSWGLKMQQTERFLDLLLDYYSLQTVLIITTAIDFEGDYRGAEIYDEKKLRRFFEQRNLFKTHLEYLSLHYLMSNAGAIKRDRVGRKTYYSLDFDRSGGVPLDLIAEGFERLDERWNRPVTKESALDEANYKALKKIALLCQSKGAHLYLVQSPIRQDVLSPTDTTFLNEKHWPRVKRVCEENGATFINLHGELSLGEEHFADSDHLNRQGAIRFSREVYQRLHLSGQ